MCVVRASSWNSGLHGRALNECFRIASGNLIKVEGSLIMRLGINEIDFFFFLEKVSTISSKVYSLNHILYCITRL